MSLVSSLIPQIRLKLGDMQATTYSNYEIVTAMNEALRALRRVLDLFYYKMTFTAPADVAATEGSDTGWPAVYNDLLVEYITLILTPGDLTVKEQAKVYWQSKVVSVSGELDAGTHFVAGYGQDVEPGSSILSPVATTGNYADLSNRPVLTSGIAFVFYGDNIADNAESARYIMKVSRYATEVTVVSTTAPSLPVTITVYQNNVPIAAFSHATTKTTYDISPDATLSVGDILFAKLSTANDMSNITVEVTAWSAE